ncbi:MAG: HNH endonuclease, partial [Desulfobacterales bacterium]|nr:HNH endonuclease [Desulfobacterales bacterium]
MLSKVFVVDGEGKPLLPTHPARARKLLESGKAAVERVVPFTVRLNRTVGNPAGSFTAGVDDGAKYAG